jgi:hypothetical protein
MTKLSWIILAAFAAVSAVVAAAVVPALTAKPTNPAGADTLASTTFYACLTSRHTLTRVSVTTPSTCPAGTVPVQWQGQAGQPVPSPSTQPTSTTAVPSSPSATQPSSTHPTSTSAPPSPPATTSSASQPPTGAACVTSAGNGNCGPYRYPLISNSNGFNTYVGNNCWADPGCKQTVSANSPGDWQVVSTEPAGNTGVKTYPNVQQLFNDWCGAGWNTCPGSDTPISALSSLRSTYAEATPHNSATIAQFAWDIWLSNTSGPNEIMIWVDNSNRGSGGATQKGSATFGGQPWTLYQYGAGEIIWSLGAPGTFAQQGSGTVDLLAMLRDLQARGIVSAGATIGQIDAGWEICSTGGGPETFRVTSYNLLAAA